MILHPAKVPIDGPPIPAAALIYRPHRAVWMNLAATKRLDFVLPKQNQQPPGDTAIVERVIAAYNRAENKPGWHPQGLWKTILDDCYEPLTDSLENNDVDTAARILEGMFGSAASVGLNMAGELHNIATPDKRNPYMDSWLDGILSLAAYLGILIEEAETGIVNVTNADFDVIYQRLTEALKVDLGFPRTCDAWGPQLDRKLMPRTIWRHIHAAHTITKRLQHTRAPRVVEIGGGFGGVAYWTHLLRPDTRFGIYDFPAINAVAGYWLLRALSSDTVSLYGEPAAPIQVLPMWEIDNIEDQGVDLVFNQNSLPEMPLETATRYLRIADRIAKHAFYSVNQESGTQLRDGEVQPRLPEIDHALRRLRLQTRYRSWIVRGYYESFYTP